MYEPLLLIHSWMRWVVLLGAIYFFVVSVYSSARKKTWTENDSHFVWAFNQVFLYQALFGLTLWIGASPIVHAALLSPKYILSESLFSFWVLRHPLTMIMAIGVFHIGRARANRRPLESRFTVFAFTFGLVLTLILSAIPWPFQSHGRVLFRGF